MKFLLSVITLLFLFKYNFGQVNLKEGSLGISVPIYNYTDNLSKLFLGIEFVYNSGNGLKLNNIPGSIGTGWSLSGLPVITRIQNGLPDDQVAREGNWDDTTKYPPGYLYNTKDISIGCPTALNKYPIFMKEGIWYQDNNITKSDREIDYFQFLINGRTGTFVIDKLTNTVLLDEGRLKINVITSALTDNCRTSISRFEITDENGLIYEFAEREMSKSFKISENDGTTFYPGNPIFSRSYDIPLSQNPYVAINWRVSKIKDHKTGREIIFEYNNETIKYEYKTALQTEIFPPCTSPPPACYSIGTVTINPVSGPSYDLRLLNTKGVIQKNEILKKEIKNIIFPDGKKIHFDSELERKDFEGTHALTGITLFNHDQSRLFKYSLNQSYLVKNEVKIPTTSDEAKWSRLCLQSVQKRGETDNIAENPYSFQYYLGTNATENFVPPCFFHASDPWGYYNGSYSGVGLTSFLADNDNDSWGKVCIYNQKHNYPGGLEIITNCKTGYAKNGLLKKVTNPFGGSTEYEYEQNYFNASYYMAYDANSQLGQAVGGVHISKIIQKNQNGTDDKILEYSFAMLDGKSSLWGEEEPKFETVKKTFWQPLGFHSAGYNCFYDYRFPGRSKVTSNTLFFDKISPLLLLNTANYTADIAVFNKARDEEGKYVKIKWETVAGAYIANLILNYSQSQILNCFNPIPQHAEVHIITSNVRINVNTLPGQFKRVTEKNYSSNNLNMGKIEYEFTSPDDFPLIITNDIPPYSNRPRAYYWMYGLTKSIKYFNNTPKLLKSIENEYDQIKNDVNYEKTRSCNCESYYQQSVRSLDWNNVNTYNDFTTSNINADGLRLKVDFYNILTGRSELKKSTEKLYTENSNDVLTSIKEYTYNNNNHLVSSIKTTDNRGRILENKTYYPEDYNLITQVMLKNMVEDNFVNIPVSSETWQTKPGGAPEMLSTSVTEFGLAPNGDYKPIKTYSLETDKPVPQNTIGVFNPNELIRDGNLIKQESEFYYDVYGNNVAVKDVQGDRVCCTIFGYGNVLPVVSVSNASANDVAYTSFELNDNSINSFYWNWSNNSGNTSNNGAQTGKRYTDGRSQTDIISYKNKVYKLSFWANGNNFILTPQILLTQKIAGPTINGWTYYEYDVAATGSYYTLSVDGNGSGIDELRLFPKNAGMITTTYDLNIGKTSECDINNRITYYEYDGLGRITKVLDEHHNIIKTYEYHFKN